MIPVDAQRMMAKRAGAKTVDQAGSHAVYVSKPEAVAAVIEQAAKGVSEKRKSAACEGRALRTRLAFGG